MKVKRDIILIFSSITVFFLALQIVFVLVCKSVDHENLDFWFSNIFRDSVYVFIMAPIYLLVASYIDKFFSIFSVVRINDRKKSILLSLEYKVGAAFVIVCEWFAFVLLLSSVFYDITKEDITKCVFGFFCYFLGFTVSAAAAEIFKRSEVKFLKSSPYFLTNGLIAFESVALIPSLFRNTPFEFPILFYWVFYWDMRGIIALLLINSLVAVYLFKVSSKKDMI